MIKNHIKAAQKSIVCLALGLAAANSASADVSIAFSKAAENEKMTQVTIHFDLTNMKPTGATVGIDFTSDALVSVATAKNDDGSPGALTIKGESKDHSKKVVYIDTAGKKTGVHIFKDFTIDKSEGANSHFSWFVGDGYFAIDSSMLEENFGGTFYINKPITEVISADVLGKKLENGKVTITSTDGVAE